MGNIMIKVVEEGEEVGKVIGVLIDWDLCKDLTAKPLSGRHHERTVSFSIPPF